HRGKSAAVNDLVWLAVFGVAGGAAIALGITSEWVLVGAWGLGATAGAALGFVQAKVRPGHVRESGRWLVDRAFPLGRWLALAGAGTGMLMLLKAVRRPRPLVPVHLFVSALTITCVVLFTRGGNVYRGVWALAVGEGTEAVLLTRMALRAKAPPELAPEVAPP